MSTECSYSNLLTSDECLKIVKNAMKCTNLKLLDFRVECASDTVGYLGDYFRLFAHVQNNKEQTRTLQFFVKTLPSSQENRRYIEINGILRKERDIYTKLLSKLQKIGNRKWGPLCYYARDDILVLEDISNLGYKHCSHCGDCEWNCLKAALQSLAALHATSLSYEKSTGTNIGEIFNDSLFEITVFKECGYWLTGIKAISAVIVNDPRYNDEKYRNFMKTEFNKRIELVYDMVNPSKKFPNVLCHRDTWGLNIFYNSQSSESSAILVDFQTCRYSPAAIDVLFCIYLNTRRKFRQKFTKKCLESYYESFAAELQSVQLNPSDIMSFDQFNTSYEELKLFAVLYNAIAVTVIHIPNDYLTRLKELNPKAYYQFSNVDRTETIMEFLRTDINFRERLYEAIDELLNVLMNI